MSGLCILIMPVQNEEIMRFGIFSLPIDSCPPIGYVLRITTNVHDLCITRI